MAASGAAQRRAVPHLSEFRALRPPGRGHLRGRHHLWRSHAPSGARACACPWRRPPHRPLPMSGRPTCFAAVLARPVLIVRMCSPATLARSTDRSDPKPSPLVYPRRGNVGEPSADRACGHIFGCPRHCRAHRHWQGIAPPRRLATDWSHWPPVGSAAPMP